MKSPRHAKFELQQLLELSYSPWESTSVDFVMTLPESERYTQIVVVVDHFSKMAHFIALPTTATAKDAATAFLRKVWKFCGLPESIISDRDTKQTSEFWEALCGPLGIKKRISTSFHPQTDRQMEEVNQTRESYLRTFINYDQDDWYSLLPLAEFAYNNSVTQATQLTPFYTNYGFHLKMIWTSSKETKSPASKAYSQ
jgi:transposase InsO family protein